MCSNPTVCIPRCLNPDFKKLKFVFSKFGSVKNIQIYNQKVVIKYNYWYKENRDLINILNNNNYINIVHEFPWFWKCFKYNSKII